MHLSDGIQNMSRQNALANDWCSPQASVAYLALEYCKESPGRLGCTFECFDVPQACHVRMLRRSSIIFSGLALDHYWNRELGLSIYI